MPKNEYLLKNLDLKTIESLKERGKKLKDIAKIYGVSAPSIVNKICREKKYPKLVARGVLEKNINSNIPINMDKIAQYYNCNVTYLDLEGAISGFSENGFGRDFNKIIINKNHDEGRQRFSIAHSLGHFLLKHQFKLKIEAKNPFYQTLYRERDITDDDEYEERQANGFASELLMPEIEIIKDIKGLKTIKVEFIDQLSMKYIVPPSIVGFRISCLGGKLD